MLVVWVGCMLRVWVEVPSQKIFSSFSLDRRLDRAPASEQKSIFSRPALLTHGVPVREVLYCTVLALTVGFCLELRNRNDGQLQQSR